MNKYKITVSKEQIILINRAVEILARVKMGQFDGMLQELKDSSDKWIFDNDLLEDVENIIKPKMGLKNSQSFGVNRFKEVGELYTIHTCIRYQMWKENPNRQSGTIDSHATDWGGGLVRIEKQLWTSKW